MFVTDEEYTPTVRQLLSSRVGAEYRLEHNEEKSGFILYYQ